MPPPAARDRPSPHLRSTHETWEPAAALSPTSTTFLMVTIRPETPADHAAVHELNRRAFAQAAEADLVDALRRNASPHLSLVAEAQDRIIGHIFFSPVDIFPVQAVSQAAPISVMGLAPMAVHPERQQQGIGSKLVREGLQACRRMGVQAVVVLGHPAYYPRFGFQPATAFGLRSEYDVPMEAFMAMELKPGALADIQGTVKYDAAFGEVE